MGAWTLEFNKTLDVLPWLPEMPTLGHIEQQGARRPRLGRGIRGMRGKST